MKLPELEAAAHLENVITGCQFMHDEMDELGLQVGQDVTIHGIAALRAQRDQLRTKAHAGEKLADVLELLLSNWPSNRDGLDGSEPLPVGVKSARCALAEFRSIKP